MVGRRALLLVVAALGAPVLLWLLFLLPLDRAIESARTDHWAATQRLIQVRSDADALKGARVTAREAAPLGITVNTVAPGPIDTPMLQQTVPAGNGIASMA